MVSPCTSPAETSRRHAAVYALDREEFAIVTGGQPRVNIFSEARPV